VVAGVISAIVAGTISFLISYQQNQDAAGQTRNAQQIQQAAQLETAAANLYQMTNNVFNFQLKCVGENLTWQQCANIAPDFDAWDVASNNFTADDYNTADQQAASLADGLTNEATATIGAKTREEAQKEWGKMLTVYVDLIFRCGLLIQGKQ
jgi:hypothetical protein